MMNRINAWRCGRRAVWTLVGIAALGGLVMLLWNALIPTLWVDGKAINYLQALGVLVLSRILFGGFRGYGLGYPRWHSPSWDALSPDEREQFLSRMRSRCAPHADERSVPPSDAPPTPESSR